MEKFKRVFFIYLGFLVFGVILKSCCETNYHIVGSGQLELYDYVSSEKYNEEDLAIVNGDFLIDVYHETVTAGSIPGLNLIESAYAYSCEDIFENKLLEESLNFSLDRAFVFDGVVISENSNLTEIKEIEVLGIDADFGRISIRFPSEFISKAQFEEDIYNFELSIETTDGLELTNRIRIRFQIN